MRLLAATAVLLFASAQAWACPELTGSFTCAYQDGSSEVVTVSQELKSGVTNYDYNGSKFPADGQSYSVNDQSLKNGTFRAWCDDNVTLRVELKGQYYTQEVYSGDLLMNLELSLAGTDLKSKTTGNHKDRDGDHPFEIEAVCTRN